MKTFKKEIITATVISLVLHMLLVMVCYLYLGRISIVPPDEEIITIDLKDDNWKIADIMPPKVEERPAEAKHIGVHDAKADEETVADQFERAPGRPVSRGGEGVEKVKEEAGRLFKSEGFAEVRPDQLGDVDPLRKIPEDFYPDYKRGPHTYINVLKHPDVAYFVRLKRVFKLAWDPTSVLMRHRMTGEISRGSIKVVLGLAVDSTGEISELFVINSSGMEDYDAEAVRAVRASAPFSAPPGKLLAADNILRVSWTFVVYM